MLVQVRPSKEALRFLTFFIGSRQTVLYCAHRTSTVSSCAFCEQEGRLPAPFLFLHCHRHRDRLQRIVGFVSGGGDDLVHHRHASKDLTKNRIGPI